MGGNEATWVVGPLERAPLSSADVGGAGIYPPQIVVVDDEPEMRDLLRDLFESDGYGVSCFDRPSLTLRSTGPLAAVFVIDLMLPEMSGIQLAGRLRNAFPQVTLIAMSASRSMIGAAYLPDLFQEVVEKPFDVDRLLGVVGRHLG